MKILCVILSDYILEDQFSNTPEGVFRIHALLKLAGHESQLLDLRDCRNDYEMEMVVKVFLSDNFDVCMTSAVTAQGNALNSFAGAFKARFPGKLLVLGGAHINSILASRAWQEDALFHLHPHVDCFAAGYYWGKADIRKLISKMGKNQIIKHKGRATKDIILQMPYEDLQKNVVSRGGGIIHRNGDVEELRTQNMLFSVGCPFNCSFCFNQLRKCCKAEPLDITCEIARRVARYGINAIKINDDDAFNNIKWNQRFLETLHGSGVKVKFLASTRADVGKSQDKLRFLVEMCHLGLKVLGFGVEWADDRVLEINKKKITVADIKESIQLIKDYTDIDILLYSIYGLPGMDNEAIDKMLEFIQWCKGRVRHISMTNFVPLIGTDIYENPESYAMKLMVPMGMQENIDWSKFYFNGKFAEIRALPIGKTPEWFLGQKAKVYQCLDECGFLRPETKHDAIKAGCMK